MKLETIQMSKNKKIILISLITLFILLLIVGIYKKAFAIEDAGYLSNQTVDNIEFKNAKETYKNNIYTYNVEIKNTLNETYNLKTIQVIFKDKDNNVIEDLTGYVGESLEPTETKILSVSVDKELLDIANIEYKISK